MLMLVACLMPSPVRMTWPPDDVAELVRDHALQLVGILRPRDQPEWT
jgi:hypothetical protein